ncbi:MAG: hypothetical protein RLP44_12655 [Aggregatilineales bacterium]
MNTSTEAVKQLQDALDAAQRATDVIDNLLAEHDYQDVASLTAQAAASLLSSAIALMQSQDESAMEFFDITEDLMEAVYNIIDGEIDDD